MTAVGLISAKGAPGATTTALALTAVAASSRHAGDLGPGLLVELDPAGGDLECWCGPLGEPGLAAVAVASGGRGPDDRLGDHTVEVVPDVRAVVAPTDAAPMGAILSSGTAAIGDALASWPGTVFVDCGRHDGTASAVNRGLLDAMDLTVVVCLPSLVSVEHTRHVVDRCRWAGRDVAVLVVGGDRPYGPSDIASALEVPVAGVIPCDRRGVGMLVDRGACRTWLRSALAIAATRCLSELVDIGALVPDANLTAAAGARHRAAPARALTSASTGMPSGTTGASPGRGRDHAGD